MEDQLVAAKFVCTKGRQFCKQARVQLSEGDAVQHYRKKQVLQEVVFLLSSVLDALDAEERLSEVRIFCFLSPSPSPSSSSSPSRLWFSCSIKPFETVSPWTWYETQYHHYKLSEMV